MNYCHFNILKIYLVYSKVKLLFVVIIIELLLFVVAINIFFLFIESLKKFDCKKKKIFVFEQFKEEILDKQTRITLNLN